MWHRDQLHGATPLPAGPQVPGDPSSGNAALLIAAAPSDSFTVKLNLCGYFTLLCCFIVPVPLLFQIFPRDLACMSTMMTFEYLSQLCQNKEQVFSLPAEAKELKGDGTQLKTIFTSAVEQFVPNILTALLSSQIHFRLELYL